MSRTRARMSITAEASTRHVGSPEDQLLIRKTFAHFPSGVSVMAAEIDGEKHALIASSFMVGVSMEPCLVAVAIQKTSQTWPRLRGVSRIGVSILAQGQGPLTRQLAARDRDHRFDQVEVVMNESGTLFIEDAALWLETAVYSETDAGDHWMILLEVTRLGVDEATEPLLWHDSRFREFAQESSIDVD